MQEETNWAQGFTQINKVTSTFAFSTDAVKIHENVKRGGERRLSTTA